MKIVADQNLRLLDRTFGRHARLLLRPGREIRPADLEDADALLVRSVTPVDEALLENTPVRFVGSATIGADHLDRSWLDERGIAWANAPGCNADAAAQYTLAAVLLANQRLGRKTVDTSAGIIGRGNVGSRVMALLQALGVRCVANDPPLADRGVPGLVSLEEALACDTVLLHVPLTREGPYPTHRMIDRRALERIGDGGLLVNAARGAVIDGDALLAELQQERIHAALDVWPEEPHIDTSLLGSVTVATPHVAGYSAQGRERGTWMIYDAFRQWRGLAPHPPDLPRPVVSDLRCQSGDPVAEAVITATAIDRDDRSLRETKSASAEERRQAFDALRRDYPVRNEFPFWRVSGAPHEARATLKKLGFSVAS